MEMHVSKRDAGGYSDIHIKLLTMLFQVLQDFFHRFNKIVWKI